MSNETKKNSQNPIPVARLDIAEGYHVDMPFQKGFSSSQVVHASEKVKIEFRPWTRHHIVTSGKHRIAIPESWCSWVPA